jgi:hypothetical protein
VEHCEARGKLQTRTEENNSNNNNNNLLSLLFRLGAQGFPETLRFTSVS